MNTIDQQITDHLYQLHLTNLTLPGKRPKTIELYPHSLRRLKQKQMDTHKIRTIMRLKFVRDP